MARRTAPKRFSAKAGLASAQFRLRYPAARCGELHFGFFYIHNLFGIAKAKLTIFSLLPEQFTGQCFSQELEFHFALIWQSITYISERFPKISLSS
jgi:hypothetical protein